MHCILCNLCQSFGFNLLSLPWIYPPCYPPWLTTLTHAVSCAAGGAARVSCAPASCAPPSAMSVTRPFTPTVPADVRDIFIRFDRNRSGRLDFAELRNALAALSVDCTNSQAAAVLKRYDGNKNGLLDLDEFSRLVKELRQLSRSFGEG